MNMDGTRILETTGNIQLASQHIYACAKVWWATATVHLALGVWYQCYYFPILCCQLVDWGAGVDHGGLGGGAGVYTWLYRPP